MKAALIALALLATPAVADTFVFSSTAQNGNDFVTVLPNGFDLVGVNNWYHSATTYYTAIALQDEVLTFNWTYVTHDTGPDWDFALYSLAPDGVHFVSGEVLGPQGPMNCCFGDLYSGTVTSILTAGTAYQFSMNSVDGLLGAGELTITLVPEPATWALLLFGFAFFGIKGIWPGASHE